MHHDNAGTQHDNAGTGSIAGGILVLVALLIALSAYLIIDKVTDEPSVVVVDTWGTPVAGSVAFVPQVNITINGGEGTPAASAPASSANADDPSTSDAWFRLALWLILFAAGGGLVYAIFRYLRESQREFFDTVSDLAKEDLTPIPLPISGIESRFDVGNLEFRRVGDLPDDVRGRIENELGELGDDQKWGFLEYERPSPAVQTAVAVSGPAKLPIGIAQRYTAEFTEVLTGKPAPKRPVAWQLHPTNVGASLEPLQDESSTFVTATKPASFRLIAQVGSPPNAVYVRELTSGATEEPAGGKGGVKVPFIGQGWVSLVLAVTLLFIITLLAIEDVLSSEALAPILGAIAGYIFGVGGGSAKGGDGK